MNYNVAYAIGFHPWEDADNCASFRSKLASLLDREEAGREAPYGRALDLGTGSAIWAVELARRGWRVTGIDNVQRALRRGRERVRQAAVDVDLIHGDVTDLLAAGVGTDYRLVLDTGTFHDFDAARREAMGRSVSAVASRDATVLLLAWPRRRRPLIRGVTRDEVEAAFPDWAITDYEPSGYQPPKVLDIVLRSAEHWYRLRRR